MKKALILIAYLSIVIPVGICGEENKDRLKPFIVDHQTIPVSEKTIENIKIGMTMDEIGRLVEYHPLPISSIPRFQICTAEAGGLYLFLFHPLDEKKPISKAVDENDSLHGLVFIQTDGVSHYVLPESLAGKGYHPETKADR